MKVETTKATDKMVEEVKVLKVDKIALYVLETEKISYKKRLETKINALEELSMYMNQFITVNPNEAFETDIKAYFIAQFKKKYSNDFPSYLRTEKLLDLLEVSITKMNEYQNTLIKL